VVIVSVRFVMSSMMSTSTCLDWILLVYSEYRLNLEPPRASVEKVLRGMKRTNESKVNGENMCEMGIMQMCGVEKCIERRNE
jgi:hypothetical protein